jgi:hypothetical protein
MNLRPILPVFLDHNVKVAKSWDSGTHVFYAIDYQVGGYWIWGYKKEIGIGGRIIEIQFKAWEEFLHHENTRLIGFAKIHECVEIITKQPPW